MSRRVDADVQLLNQATMSNLANTEQREAPSAPATDWMIGDV